MQGSLGEITGALIPYIESEIRICDTLMLIPIIRKMRARITASLHLLFKMSSVSISSRTRSHRFTVEFPLAIDSDLLDRYMTFR